MSSDRIDFINMVKLDSLLWVTLANGQQVEDQGRGSVRPYLDNGNTVRLTDVMYVPKLDGKLLSVSALSSRGVVIQFDQDHATISVKESVVDVDEEGDTAGDGRQAPDHDVNMDSTEYPLFKVDNVDANDMRSDALAYAIISID